MSRLSASVSGTMRESWRAVEMKEGVGTLPPFFSFNSCNLLDRNEIVSSILRPASLIFLGAGRPFLAIADGVELLSVYAEADKICLRGISSLLTECQVVFDGTSFVTVSFNTHFRAWIRLEPVKVLLEDFGISGPDVVLIIIKVNRL